MSDKQVDIRSLEQRLNNLLKKQDVFFREIKEIRHDISLLKDGFSISSQTEPSLVNDSFEYKQADTSIIKPSSPSTMKAPRAKSKAMVPDPIIKLPSKKDLEKFIGENLISKIGIIILIIGVGIGTKYSIEHNLVSPLTRIITSYLMSIGLLGFGIKLKKKYTNYSAVLVSGAIAILYTTTFLAYNLYELIPQPIAFVLMLVFTIFTVITALHYNKQVIAHIGLVGAYAVPALLSSCGGNIIVFFSYIALINFGILLISIKKNWKPLYYAAFVQTWLIYASWLIGQSNLPEDFNIAIIFSIVFFSIFYVTFLAYKLLKKEWFNIGDIVLLLANSGVFYGIGMYILAEHPSGKELLGIFTLINALIHFGVSTLLHKQKAVDKNLLHLITGLVLVFITIAIPVQLDGNWVTLIWAAEALVLFSIGRIKKVAIYEILSYPLIALASFSLVEDWGNAYGFVGGHYTASTFSFLFNIHFASSLFCLIALGTITYLHFKYKEAFKPQLTPIISYGLGGLFIIAFYQTFRLEINMFWDQLYSQSFITRGDTYSYKIYNDNYKYFGTLSILCYSMVFLGALSLVNILKIKNKTLGKINLGLNGLLILVFLLQGLYTISLLRDNYLLETPDFEIGSSVFIVRYLSIVLFIGFVILSKKYIDKAFVDVKPKLIIISEIALAIIGLWILSSEVVQWLSLNGIANTYKLGISIVWGVYAIILIGIGVWKKKPHIRILALILCAIAVLKLFIYDISHLNTIHKTIVFVALGIILLIISFIYNKYVKHLDSEK